FCLWYRKISLKILIYEHRSESKKIQRRKKWSQEDLAIRLDTTQTTISNIESDKNIPNSVLLNKIAKELDVDINQLLDDKFSTYNQIDQNDGVVNLVNGTVNMHSPELIQNIMNNQQAI